LLRRFDEYEMEVMGEPLLAMTASGEIALSL
jgi:hypothetical protein